MPVASLWSASKLAGSPTERNALKSLSVPFAADVADGLDGGSTVSELALVAAAAEVFVLQVRDVDARPGDGGTFLSAARAAAAASLAKAAAAGRTGHVSID
jgi:hypothetical protein